MRVWIVCFILLFGGAELLQWIQQFSLPLPIFILGGAFLAIMSNYRNLTHLPFHPDYEEPDTTTQVPGVQPSAEPVATRPTAERSISYEIRKPFQPGD